jgi:hypothetical protein
MRGYQAHLPPEKDGFIGFSDLHSTYDYFILSSPREKMGSLGPRISTVDKIILSFPPEKEMGSLGPQISTVHERISGSLPPRK